MSQTHAACFFYLFLKKKLIKHTFLQCFIFWKLMDDTYIENSYNAYIFDSFKSQRTLEISHWTMPLTFVNWSIYENIKIHELELAGMNLIIQLTKEFYSDSLSLKKIYCRSTLCVILNLNLIQVMSDENRICSTCTVYCVST